MGLCCSLRVDRLVPRLCPFDNGLGLVRCERVKAISKESLERFALRPKSFRGSDGDFHESTLEQGVSRLERYRRVVADVEPERQHRIDPSELENLLNESAAKGYEGFEILRDQPLRDGGVGHVIILSGYVFDEE